MQENLVLSSTLSGNQSYLKASKQGSQEIIHDLLIGSSEPVYCLYPGHLRNNVKELMTQKSWRMQIRSEHERVKRKDTANTPQTVLTKSKCNVLYRQYMVMQTRNLFSNFSFFCQMIPTCNTFNFSWQLSSNTITEKAFHWLRDKV